MLVFEARTVECLGKLYCGEHQLALVGASEHRHDLNSMKAKLWHSESRGANLAASTDCHLVFRWVLHCNSLSSRLQVLRWSLNINKWICKQVKVEFLFQNQQISHWISLSLCSFHTSVGNWTVSLTEWKRGKWNRLPRNIWPYQRVLFEMPYQLLHFSDQLLSTLECYVNSIWCALLCKKERKKKSLSHFFFLKLKDDILFAFHETSNEHIIKSSQ